LAIIAVAAGIALVCVAAVLIARAVKTRRARMNARQVQARAAPYTTAYTLR
jgi:hypothetical protein